MGFHAVSAVLAHSKATSTTKLVLVALAHYYDDDGKYGAWPSQALLARLANCSERTARRALKELSDAGEIDVLLHQGVGHDPQRRTNRYRILVDCPETCDKTTQHKLLTLAAIPDRLTGQIGSSDRTNWVVSQDTGGRLTIKNNH
jgi:hypothetical protein